METIDAISTSPLSINACRLLPSGANSSSDPVNRSSTSRSPSRFDIASVRKSIFDTREMTSTSPLSINACRLLPSGANSSSDPVNRSSTSRSPSRFDIASVRKSIFDTREMTSTSPLSINACRLLPSGANSSNAPVNRSSTSRSPSRFDIASVRKSMFDTSVARLMRPLSVRACRLLPMGARSSNAPVNRSSTSRSPSRFEIVTVRVSMFDTSENRPPISES